MRLFASLIVRGIAINANGPLGVFGKWAIINGYNARKYCHTTAVDIDILRAWTVWISLKEILTVK
jgi:lipopolysaccharide/colanic/teichoic acid biosynthesis glycosyltransferase